MPSCYRSQGSDVDKKTKQSQYWRGKTMKKWKIVKRQSDLAGGKQSRMACKTMSAMGLLFWLCLRAQVCVCDCVCVCVCSACQSFFFFLCWCCTVIGYWVSGLERFKTKHHRSKDAVASVFIFPKEPEKPQEMICEAPVKQPITCEQIRLPRW